MDTFNKQPGDVLDYDVDMVRWFKSLPGDDIQGVELSVRSIAGGLPTLVLGPHPHPPVVLMGSNPQRFKVWIGGGDNYQDYVVTCLVSTAQDRKKEVEFKIKVREL